jgi:predicted nucleotidyltransferase
MWLRAPLEDILSSRAKIAVLRVLCTSRVPLHGREVARRAGVGTGHVSRILRELVNSGVICATDQGRAMTYELSRPCPPLVQQLVALFNAESVRQERAVKQLESAVPGLVSLVLFGSEARGEAAAGSDTDLLLVVRERSERTDDVIRDKCLQLAQEEGLALSWHVADLDDLRAWEQAGGELWTRILAEGQALSGKPLWRLRQLCQPGATG